MLIDFERHTGESWGLDLGKVHWGTGGGQSEGHGATGVKVFGTDKTYLEEPRAGLESGFQAEGQAALWAKPPVGPPCCSSELFLGLCSTDISPHLTLRGLGRSDFLFLD